MFWPLTNSAINRGPRRLWKSVEKLYVTQRILFVRSKKRIGRLLQQKPLEPPLCSEHAFRNARFEFCVLTVLSPLRSVNIAILHFASCTIVRHSQIEYVALFHQNWDDDIPLTSIETTIKFLMTCVSTWAAGVLKLRLGWSPWTFDTLRDGVPPTGETQTRDAADETRRDADGMATNHVIPTNLLWSPLMIFLYVYIFLTETYRKVRFWTQTWRGSKIMPDARASALRVRQERTNGSWRFTRDTLVGKHR